MIITIQDIEKAIKNIFNESTAQSVDSVYEKADGGYRLVIDIKNLFYKKTNIIYTKLLFNVDENKVYLLPNKSDSYQFKYLYDINCNYDLYYFDTIEDFESKIKSIMSENKFGKNIKILSQFIKSPSSLINNWFSENNVRNISVFNVSLDERYKIIACKSIFFHFTINLNNQMDISLIVEKDGKNNYIYTFKIYDKTINIEKPDLSTLVEVIGDTLRSKYV